MRLRKFTIALLLLLPLCFVPAFSQSTKGIISGDVKDSQAVPLQGARVTLEPQIRPIVSNGQGEFTIADVTPGTYAVTVTYVGFKAYAGSVTVVAGQTAHVEAVLQVANANEEVIVTAERPRGEAEAINRTRAAENILQVLPAEVITSLPNANIADALGRMASVTIERDEGEGKYVQIRGTEPRLSNTMVDGVTIPSPESGFRQVKLDTIASDLVESVEINKTLQANIDADGIGGSVNLVTKTAGDTPTINLSGIGGYTPILNGGRTTDQFNATIGRRFLTDRKLGLLGGFTYDYNGRGINDIEPSPTTDSLTPHYDGIDLRDYIYYRTRWGATGTADLKLSEGSSISLRGLYSTFRNWGNKWVYSLNDGDVPKYSQDWRRPNFAVGSVSLHGRHIFNANTVLWDVAVGRARSLGGSGSAKYSWIGDPDIACVNDQSVAKSVYRPGFSAGCFGQGADNALDRNNYKLKSYAPPTFGQSVQLNLEGAGSYARLYHIGSHFGTFEFGGKVRTAHKFDDTYDETYVPNSTFKISDHPELNSDFTDPSYYDKTYGPFGTVTDWSKLRAVVQQNGGEFSLDEGGPGVNANNYNFVERVSAGFLMNTIELASRVRLVTGLRFEATHLDTRSFDGSLPNPPSTLTFKGGGDYLDVLPSASLRFAIDKDSDLRLAYGRGLARPDPTDVSAAVAQPDLTVNPAIASIGNPKLKAERANNYDILYERYLTPLGLIQAGYFYKDLSDPIVTQQLTSLTYPGNVGGKTLVSQRVNAGSGHVQGVEFSYQQRLSFLPGVLHGAGFSANYSYTASQAKGVDPLRTDTPALLRQAPNSWNISPTYDTKHFSIRVGMTFDDAMIYNYQYENLAYQVDEDGNPILDPTTGKQLTMPNPQVGNTKGPAGDNYLYAHYQFDTQASYKLPFGFQIYGYGLNLNNEVFGFYNGSTQYVVQREYYHPTYAGGIRWTSSREK